MQLNSIALYILILMMTGMLYSCQKDELAESEDPVKDAPIGVRVYNDLEISIDSLQINVNSELSEKSLTFRSIPSKGASGYIPLDSLQFYHKKPDDFLFIYFGKIFSPSGSFITGNCFCDPTYMKDLLREGKYTIVIYQADALRGTFDYEIYRD